MNNKQIDNGLLINEWQLGSQLNVAVANGTRDKFNLLLSLLSDDARDFSQFDSPKATVDSLSEQELRESLSLAEAQPLVNSGLSLQQAKSINLAVQQRDLSAIRLQSLLHNEALLSRNNKTNFDPEVVDNLPFLSQQRLKNNSHNDETIERQAAGVDYGLLQNIESLNLDKKPIKVNYM